MKTKKPRLFSPSAYLGLLRMSCASINPKCCKGKGRDTLREYGEYGVISGELVAPRTWKITGTIEKSPLGQAPSNLPVVVKYILTPPILDALAKVKPTGGEVFIAPAINAYLKVGGEFYGYEVKGTWYEYGVNSAFSRPRWISP